MGSNLMSKTIVGFSHSKEMIKWIDSELNSIGIYNYKFCKENVCYICDELGNFYSVCHRQKTKSGNIYENYRIRKLKGSIDRDGYVTYRIRENGIKKHLKAHRMMLNAWIGTNPLKSVNHIDGNKLNNSLDNLEWTTTLENNIHALNSGLKSGKLQRRCGRYRINTADWMTIYILNKHCGYSKTKLAEINDCSRPVIAGIMNRLDKVMKGVIF